MDKNVFCTCAKARFTLIRVKTAEADVIPERVREEAERRILIVVQVARRAFRRLSVLSTETDLKEWREAWKADKAMIHAGHLGTKSLGDLNTSVKFRI